MLKGGEETWEIKAVAGWLESILGGAIDVGVGVGAVLPSAIAPERRRQMRPPRGLLS